MEKTKVVYHALGTETSSTAAIVPQQDDWIFLISSHPISSPAAVILNKLYQSYLGVDYAISQAGSAAIEGSRSRKTKSQDLEIHRYFASCGLAKNWESGIATLAEQYRAGILTPVRFKESLERIMVAAEKLEDAQAMVEQSLEIELERGVFGLTVPESFWDFIEARSRALETACRGLEKRLEE